MLHGSSGLIVVDVEDSLLYLEVAAADQDLPDGVLLGFLEQFASDHPAHLIAGRASVSHVARGLEAPG